jgi:hypothetical protein
MDGFSNAELQGVNNLETREVHLQLFQGALTVKMVHVKFGTFHAVPAGKAQEELFFEVSGPTEIDCFVSPETAERLRQPNSPHRLLFKMIDQKHKIAALLFID